MGGGAGGPRRSLDGAAAGGAAAAAAAGHAVRGAIGSIRCVHAGGFGGGGACMRADVPLARILRLLYLPLTSVPCLHRPADRVVAEALSVLATVAEQRDHFSAVMAALLACLRGASGARLLQARPLPALSALCRCKRYLCGCLCGCLRSASGTGCIALPCSQGRCAVLCCAAPSACVLFCFGVQRRGGMIIQKLCERLGGLRVYRELSRLLEASQPAT